MAELLAKLHEGFGNPLARAIKLSEEIASVPVALEEKIAVVPDSRGIPDFGESLAMGLQEPNADRIARLISETKSRITEQECGNQEIVNDLPQVR